MEGLQLTVTFTDVSVPDNAQLELRATLSPHCRTIKFKSTGTLLAASFAPETPLVLQLLLQGREIAVCTLQLGFLCGKGPTGVYDK